MTIISARDASASVNIASPLHSPLVHIRVNTWRRKNYWEKMKNREENPFFSISPFPLSSISTYINNVSFFLFFNIPMGCGGLLLIVNPCELSGDLLSAAGWWTLLPSQVDLSPQNFSVSNSLSVAWTNWEKAIAAISEEKVHSALGINSNYFIYFSSLKIRGNSGHNRAEKLIPQHLSRLV